MTGPRPVGVLGAWELRFSGPRTWLDGPAGPGGDVRTRTREVVVSDWSAGISRGSRYLSGTLLESGCVAGSRFGALWVEVSERWWERGSGEASPLIYRRRLSDSWAREVLTAAARRETDRQVAEQVHAAGGFDALWRRLWAASRLTSTTEGTRARARELAEAAAYACMCAELGDAIAAGAAEVVAMRRAEIDEVGRVRVPGTTGRLRDWSPPAARVMVGGELVGWLTDDGALAVVETPGG